MRDMYGFLTYETDLYRHRGWINLGDYVQTIAARQFLPEPGIPIQRDNIKNYHGYPVKMIMNAWYMDSPENFPPSDKIKPLYTSIHINSLVADKMLTHEAISHFRKLAPIGCRDLYTKNLLASHGIDSYFSSCLTLTLGESYRRDSSTCTDEVYFIDVMHDSFSLSELIRQPLRLIKRILNGRIREINFRKNVIDKYFDESLIKKSKFETQIIPYVSAEEGISIAGEFLERLSRAKLVVTSRIHTALPCLAMGTPVIFINGGFENEVDNCRFEGIIDLFNRIDVDRNGVSTVNFPLNDDKIGLKTVISNKYYHLEYIDLLRAKCNDFMRS